jgi:predicted metal-dependent hydrolase
MLRIEESSNDKQVVEIKRSYQQRFRSTIIFLFNLASAPLPQPAEKLDVQVRSMSKKWASYSTNGALTFDIKLLDLDTELQDYVIVHELLHFHVPNHGRLWKSLMRAHLGEYEKAETLLCEAFGPQTTENC